MSIESVDKFLPGRLSYDSVIQFRDEHLFVAFECFDDDLGSSPPSLGRMEKMTTIPRLPRDSQNRLSQDVSARPWLVWYPPAERTLRWAVEWRLRVIR